MKAHNDSAAREEQPAPTRASRPGVSRPGARKAGEATRERILDAAEAVFSRDGYHGASMREVAEAADTRIALVTYHFGNKDTLFDKVIERRASYMALQRIRALDAARNRAAGGPIPVRELVDGYVWPFVERSSNGGPGWKNYTLLVGRAANSPNRTEIKHHYDAVARHYLAEFRRSLPDVDEEVVYQAFSFMVGALLGLGAQPGWVESLSGRRFAASDLKRVYASMLPFLVGGFAALPGARPDATK